MVRTVDYTNIKKVAAIGGIEEYNICHAIISRALFVGLERAVREMVDLIKYA
jgi:pyridoxine 5-phosphate synthase